MSIERELQAVIREEVEAAIAPLRHQLEQLHQHGKVVEKLSTLLSGRATSRQRRTSGTEPACAIIGCTRDARSKGYCNSHYQKRRMLQRTNRLPADWIENAQAHTVKNLVLPRGRHPS